MLALPKLAHSVNASPVIEGGDKKIAAQRSGRWACGYRGPIGIEQAFL